ncbi:ParB/RepB/Spo0J family partition protein [Citreimonas salinaria]|uniref:Chromosome partitioning protein, ParB family n=1 Tax=Citreimonas salinaria TaxID=321339 RepID=A0A1H3NB69_9RHOB|nr:ParB/RepB/Spo0J family partition protein [Citreimonas salinaria]SDY86004.1 chromosome partitioning protein, ParB family [Citreimonas salinaria]
MVRSVFNISGEPPKSDTDPQTEAEPRPARRKPMVRGGAASEKYIAAATRGGGERSYQDIPVNQVTQSPINDRIDVNEDIESLIQSIRENGQQIPVIVRHARGDMPYEIVVGRRRLAAIKAIGQPTIKAFVTRMDDREAFITQGIENTARLETSYIERARAASLAIDADFSQTDVSEFLNISQTLMSFMIKTYQNVGEDVVVAIGPARGIGRRKWDSLHQEMKRKLLSQEVVLAMVDTSIKDSADRFEAVLAAVKAWKASPESTSQKESNAPVTRSYMAGQVRQTRRPRELRIKIGRKASHDLLERIERAIARELENDDNKGGYSSD